MKGKQWILAAMAAAALVMPLSSYAAAAPQASPAAVTQKAQVPAPAYADSTLQATRYGLLQGAQEGDDFVWRGVPYGQAERWKTPEDPSSWTDVRDALKTGPMGTQETAKGVKGAESCLNLDIFRPATKEQNLPVLYFIHGGNNQNGAADQVNLSQFAKRANVVAVSINYRLGALGYNPLPAVHHGTKVESSGNYGFLDALQGLDWVKENIANFGGNPDNITVSGFSSGGRDVMALLISPEAKGKFQKAISFSGGMTTSDPSWAIGIYAKAFAPLVVADGVKPNEKEAIAWLKKDTPEVAKYLNGLQAERIATAFGHAGIRMAAFPHLFTDGTVLPKDGFKTKKWNEVPLIMTTGTDEFSLYTRINPYFAPSVKDKTVFTDEKKYAEFTFSKKYGSEMYRLFNAEASAEQMLDRYKAPIYTMTIAYGNNPELVGPETASLSGSVHGIWIPFVTGYATSTTASYPKGSFDNPGALDLTRKVQQYIGNFMWDGNPNGQGLPTWNQWTSTKTGPSNLVVNADGEKANIQMTDTRSSYDEVFKEMEADKTVDKKDKEAIIHNVLNGRWWSKPLDQHFGTKTK